MLICLCIVVNCWVVTHTKYVDPNVMFVWWVQVPPLYRCLACFGRICLCRLLVNWTNLSFKVYVFRAYMHLGPSRSDWRGFARFLGCCSTRLHVDIWGWFLLLLVPWDVGFEVWVGYLWSVGWANGEVP